ncbi:hypothetical protein Tco_0782435 [Tanacetum coccineum]
MSEVPNKESMFRIDEKNVEESGPNKESMTGIDEKNVKESGPIPKEEVVSEPYWINVKESVLPMRNVFPDANEVNQFVESLDGEVVDAVNRIVNFRIKMYGVADNPQAFYIFVVFGDPETHGPYGGYAVEIFLEDSFYDICGIQRDLTGEHRKIVIPKKKSMGIETIGGYIIFFCEKKFYKPTLWRPT